MLNEEAPAVSMLDLKTRSSISGAVPPLALAVTGLAIMAAPRSATALSSLVAGLLATAPLLASAWLSRGAIPRRAYVPLALALGAVVWLGLSSAMATNPAVSFWGIAGQHTGSLTWIVASVWFIAFAASPRRERLLVAALAAIGGLAGIFATLDAVFGAGAPRFSPEISGLLESSASLGQLLVLTLPCTVASLLTETMPNRRTALAASGLLQSVAFVVCNARGAWVGLVAGLTAAWLLTRGGRPREGRPWRLGAVFVVGALAVVVAPRFDVPILPALLNQRWVIWRSASAGTLSHPLLGRGPDQFSAWFDWGSGENGALSASGAYDPHSLPLYWAVSSGIPGLLLATAVIVALVTALGGVGRRAAGERRVLLMLAGVLGFGVTLLSTWVHPLPLFFAAALSGSLLAERLPSHEHRSRVLLPAAVVATTAAFIVLGVFRHACVLEFRWAQEELPSIQEAKAAHDPLYASLVGRRMLADAAKQTTGTEGVANQVLALTASRERDMSWHCDIALTQAEAASALGPGAWGALRTALEQGRKGDSTTGLWDFVGATQADRMGRGAEAKVFARQAITHQLPQGARSTLQPVLSRQ